LSDIDPDRIAHPLAAIATDPSMGTDTFWHGRRVIVTGGSGFLGSFVVERLEAANCGVKPTPKDSSPRRNPTS